MELRDFEFALFIKDKSTNPDELQNRKALFQGTHCGPSHHARRDVRSVCADAAKRQSHVSPQLGNVDPNHPRDALLGVGVPILHDV